MLMLILIRAQILHQARLIRHYKQSPCVALTPISLSALTTIPTLTARSSTKTTFLSTFKNCRLSSRLSYNTTTLCCHKSFIANRCTTTSAAPKRASLASCAIPYRLPTPPIMAANQTHLPQSVQSSDALGRAALLGLLRFYAPERAHAGRQTSPSEALVLSATIIAAHL